MKTGMGKSSRVPSRPNNNSHIVSGWAEGFGAQTTGYTILEVIIFLAVTTGLFVAIAASFQGYQAKTEFSVAVREMESRLRDVTNDVASGYYGSSGNFSCDVNASGDIQIVSSNQSQGTNPDCIFVGKTLHFRTTDSDRRSYNVMSLVGRRTNGSGALTDSYSGTSGARPRILTPATESQKLPVGLVFGGMKRRFNNPAHPDMNIAAVGILSSLGILNSRDSQNAEQAVIRIQYVVPLPHGNSSAGVGVDEATIQTYYDSYVINNEGVAVTNVDLSINIAADSIDICLDSDGTDQHVVYSIDAKRTLGSISTRVGSSSCATNGY